MRATAILVLMVLAAGCDGVRALEDAGPEPDAAVPMPACVLASSLPGCEGACDTYSPVCPCGSSPHCLGGGFDGWSYDRGRGECSLTLESPVSCSSGGTPSCDGTRRLTCVPDAMVSTHNPDAPGETTFCGDSRSDLLCDG